AAELYLAGLRPGAEISGAFQISRFLEPRARRADPFGARGHAPGDPSERVRARGLHGRDSLAVCTGVDLEPTLPLWEGRKASAARFSGEGFSADGKRPACFPRLPLP